MAKSGKKPAAATSVKMEIPKSLPACVDRLAEVKDLLKRSAKEHSKLEALRIALEKHLIETLPKSKASGIAGKVARAQIESQIIPTPKDWAKIHKYMAKNDAFDLVQRRLSTKAVEERWEAGKQVPGVEKFTLVKVKLTMLKEKEKVDG